MSCRGLHRVSIDRGGLRELIEQLPDYEVASAADGPHRRIAGPKAAGTWPPDFFGILDGDEVPPDLADDVDRHLAALGFDRDSL